MFTPANLRLPAELATAIINDPLTIAPDASVVDAIALMNAGSTTNNCTGENNFTSNSLLFQAQHSCVLVLENTKLVGIVTAKNLLHLTGFGQNLAEIAIAEVMSSPVQTLPITNFTDIFVPLSLFQHYLIRHLPLINDQGQVVGLLTHDSLRQLLRFFDLLNLLTTADVMGQAVVQASPTATIPELSQLMTNHGVSSVVIVDCTDAKVIPVGIVTERDIVDLLGIEPDLSTFTAQRLMSREVNAVAGDTFLGEVWQLMQQRQINQVIVTRHDGELLGIVTQSLVLSVFNPVTISALVERLVQERTCKIQEQVAREQLLMQIANQIRASLNLDEVLDNAVTALRDFLQCDRLLVYQFQPDWNGTIVAESVTGNWQALKAVSIHDPCFRQEVAELYRQGKTLAIDNIYNYGYAACYLALLEQYQVKANLVVPILVTDKLWGLLVGHQCADYRHWQPGELTLLHEISVQLAIAIQQATAYQQLQAQNAILERIAKAEPLTEILHDLLQTIEMQLDNVICTIMLHDGNGKLNFGISTQLPASYMQQMNGVSIGEGVGSCGTAAFRRETVIVADIATDPLWQDYRDLALVQGLKACWSLAIIGSDGQLLGVFGVYYQENRTPDSCERETVTQAANIASIAIERHLATQSLQQLNQELENRVAERTAALQASEERWQLVLRGTNDGIWDWDLQTNKIFYSQRWKQMRGFSDDEIADSPNECLSRIHPEDCDRVMAAIDDHFARKTEFFEAEYRTQCQDGSYMWVLDRGQALRDESGQVIRMTGSETDITQRKLAEAALRESQRRYATLAAAAPVAIFRFDEPLNCVYVNDRWSQMTGRPKESALGKGWIEALHPEDREQRLVEWTKNVTQSLVGNHTIDQGEGRHLRPDGSINWFYVQVAPEVDANGQIIGYIGTLTDITARKIAEQENQQLEERLQFLLSASPAVIFTCQPEGDYGATFISDNLYNVTGYTPAEFLAESRFWIDRVHPEDILRLLAQSPLLSSGLHIHEYRFRHQQGHYIWLRAELRVVRNQQGTPIEFIGYFADISDRKQTELALEESQRFIQQIADASPNMLYLCDLQTQSNIYVNREITSILGYNPEAVQAMGENMFTILLHPDDFSQLPSRLARLNTAADGEIIELEYRMRHADGNWRWLYSRDAVFCRDEEGKVLQIIGAAQDITDRKLAEQENQLLKERLQFLLASSPAVIFTCRTEEPYSITFISENSVDVTGYTSAEFFSHSSFWRDRIHLGDVSRVLEGMSQLFEQGHHTHEYRFLHTAGHYIWLRNELRLVCDRQGNPIEIVGYAADISDRKQAELALQESQRFIQQIADASPNMLYLYDLQAQRNLYGNRAITSILGYSVEAVQAMGSNLLTDLFHPDDLPRLIDQREQMKMLADGEIMEFEYRMQHANGEWRWLYSWDTIFSRDADGKVQQIIGTAQDISDRKRLEASQNRLIALLEASTDYILIADITGNAIWNNTALKLLRGLDDAEITQQKPSDYHPQKGVELLEQEAVPIAIANGSWLGENILLDAQGQEIPVSQLLLSHKSPQGEVEFFSTIMRDIRSQKEYEQTLERTNAELLRATRLKDEFLANMSHELRTPLNAVLGMSESLLDMIFGQLNDQQQQAIATIERSGQHLLSLINDILELSKIEANKLELQITQVSVAQLCKTSLDFVKQQAFKKQIHLHLSLPTFAKEIAVDERRIQQVLINLLSNAIKFTPNGGRVSLHVKVQNFGEVADNMTWILFSVSDTGIGIAPADQARLFQPFVQIDSSLNRKYEGTGLGLVLVKRITEMHGGYVSLRSELGQGSCFTVCLPDSACQLQPSSTFSLSPFLDLAPNSIAIAPPEIITAPTTTNSPLILLAEDNEANINTISSYLEAKGYRVLMAKNGQEAIDLTYSHHPDLIIMDIQMPLVDGLVAIKQIRKTQELATIPIVALTAMAMLGDRERCIAAGANEYVAKPIKLKQLTAMIEQLLTIN
ncbi:PAS domain-containing protein [Tolypothrix sp. FACHB-123]|uniref:PAS domain-containing protein n=1 Tax=Tolypothrix sp. FACHB-123 TaxID=2692868 RepID=UPI00168994BF|nr:PAS domain-containing protein [Tolypothrix sp. FACHB-123]MBD2355325.1 PAS domain-containing protein [Tolypothrix sp. FACHB-123]